MLPLGLGFALALGLAYQTWDATRDHRTAAEATVRDHAAFGAHILAGRVDRRMSQAMLYAFYYVDLAVRDGERWPGVDALRAAQELHRCEEALPPSDRVFFRWVAGAARAPEGARPFGLRFGAPGIGPAGVAYRVFHDGEDAALYGLDNCFRDQSGEVFEEALGEAGVLPPTLIGDTPNDSLFAFAALDADGQPIQGQWNPDYGGFVGTARVAPEDAYGGLSLAIRLTDATAERLVIGGLPRSRLPEALALVALTALLLGAAARQLRRGQELLEARERFVAGVSHELRTPLQQILLFADLLRLSRVSGQEETLRAASVIHRETRRLINLVENVLSFSRPPPDRAAAQGGDTALLSLAGTVVESFRPIADERDVRLVVSGDEVAVRGDPDSIRQVLINLLDNAVKYGPEGQTIRLQVARREEMGVVTVSDEGPGIPPRERERIWEAYVRLDRDARALEAGQGVGLAIVRDLVAGMKGRARVVDYGPGACFEIEIPLET